MNIDASDEHIVRDQTQSERSDALRGLREGARMTTDAVCEAGYKASAVMKELGDGAYQFGSKTGARVARQVEAQPLTSALIAASLGVIVGMWLSRR